MKKNRETKILKLSKVKITKLSTSESMTIYGGTNYNNGCADKTKIVDPGCRDTKRPNCS